jgi:hypothetical protein
MPAVRGLSKRSSSQICRECATPGDMPTRHFKVHRYFIDPPLSGRNHAARLVVPVCWLVRRGTGRLRLRRHNDEAAPLPKKAHAIGIRLRAIEEARTGLALCNSPLDTSELPSQVLSANTAAAA